MVLIGRVSVLAGSGCFIFDGVLTLCRELWAAADELNDVIKQRDTDAGPYGHAEHFCSSIG